MSDTLQILEKLNTFYSGAFTQLITYTVGVLAFIGIFIPFLIATIQNKQLKKDQTSLSSQIEEELTSARNEIKQEIETQMLTLEEKLQQLVSETKKEIGLEIKKIDRLAEARTLHLQAAASQIDRPGSAEFDALTAAEVYASYKDEQNLIASLRLLEMITPNLVKTDFDKYDIDKACESAIASIQKLNGNGRYTQEISSLKQLVAAAKKRD